MMLMRRNDVGGHKTKCIACEGLRKKLKEAREKNDSQLAKIAYGQMREHLSRVKYPRKHGWTNADFADVKT